MSFRLGGVAAAFWLVTASAWAQDPPVNDAAQETVATAFAEAVGLCRDAMLSREALAALPAAQAALVEAPPEVRASHPLGAVAQIWILSGRADVTLVELESRSCNVYATNANVAEAFELGAVALTSAGFIESEAEQRRAGGIERNFRSADRNVRVELQTFGEGAATDPPAADVLTMALFGRRR